MNVWVIIYRFAWIVLIILFGIGLVCVFLPKYNSLCELQRRKAELQEQNRQTAALTTEFQLKQERFRTDAAFVERVARETGMVKPDEIVFHFSNDQATAVATSAP